MSKRTRQRLFIKVCRTVDAAEQSKALRLLNEPRLLADPRNRVIRECQSIRNSPPDPDIRCAGLLDTFQAPFRGYSVTFFVHPEAGVPCCDIDWLRTDDCVWIGFVHQLFKVGRLPGSFDRRRLIDVLCCIPKTLDLFHECGIAHLDMCVPAHDDAAQVY